MLALINALAFTFASLRASLPSLRNTANPVLISSLSHQSIHLNANQKPSLIECHYCCDKAIKVRLKC